MASQKSAMAPSARGISSLIEPEVSSTTLSIQDVRLRPGITTSERSAPRRDGSRFRVTIRVTR